MSWQDEQRRLDEELSAGQLSAEDYERRRDELRSQHTTGDADAGGDQPETGQAQQAATPFPPAFRWETKPDEGNETTQLFTPVDADETQVVTPQPNDTDRTQVVYGGPRAQQGPQRPVARESAPPWASSDLPPMQQPDPVWTRQPEPFESEQPSNAPRIAIVAAVVVVVLLLIGGGVATYWLVSGDGTQADQSPAPAPQQPAAGEQQPPAPQPGADLPDPAGIGGDGQPRVVPTLSELQAADVLTPQEYAVVADAGATASKVVVSSFEDGPTASVLITRLDGGEEAAAVRDELAAVQREAGLKQSEPTQDPGLETYYLFYEPGVVPTVRGFYRSGDLLVRIEVVGPEPRPTASRYDIIVPQQLATLAADE